MQTIQRYNPSFQSIKPTLRTCDDLTRGVKNEFLNSKSSTKTGLRIYQAKEINAPENIINKLMDRFKKQSDEISRIREHYEDIFDKSDFSAYAEALGDFAKENKLIECGEMADIVKKRLMDKGIKTKTVNILMNPFTQKHNRLFDRHTFLVANLKKGADISNPKTWGNKAVIIDPWVGEALPANKMIKRYNQLFDIDEKHECLEFVGSDYSDIHDFLA